MKSAVEVAPVHLAALQRRCVRQGVGLVNDDVFG